MNGTDFYWGLLCSNLVPIKHESDSAGLEPLSLAVGGHQFSQRRVLLDLEMNHRPILQRNNSEPQQHLDHKPRGVIYSYKLYNRRRNRG